MGAGRWVRFGVGAILVALVAGGVEAAAEVVEPAAQARAQAAKVESRPDLVSASVTARAQGSRVEVEALRTETATTWVNPDGTLTEEVHVAPVRYRDHAGALRDVDLNWRRGHDGTIAPGGHPHGVRLGKKAKSDSVFAAAGVGGDRQVEWIAPWALPEPVLDGVKATYPDIEPQVDLVVNNRRSGFEYDFVVKGKPAAAPVWRIPLRLKGLTPKQRPDGAIEFRDARDQVHSVIPVAYMWDAAVDERTGEPVNKATVNIAVEGSTLVITPDPAWFNDSRRSFPVTVDPTYAVQNAYPNFDTWVQSDYASDQSASAELKLGTYNGGSVKARSFLNVPVAPFKGKQIISATFSIFETWSYSCTPSTFIVRSAQTASTSSRWTSQPPIGSQYGSTSVAKGHDSGCPAGRTSVSITPLVQAWSNATYATGGMVLMAANESDSNSWKRFHSSEGSADPYISFTYNRAPSTPLMPAFSSAVPYAAPGGSTYLYTPYLRPWVTSKGSDADGNTVKYEFEFHTSTAGTSATLKATCSSATYPSGTTAGCQPGVDLPDNTAIVVRARTFDGTLRSGWSAWVLVRVGVATPAVPTITCPYPNGSWTDTVPATTFTCTIAAPGPGYNAPGYVRVTVDGVLRPTNFTGGAPGQLKITPSADPAIGKATITMPNTAGLHTIQAQAETPAGRLSGQATYSLGFGGATLGSPAVTPRTTTTSGVRISASGPPKGSSATPTASVRWRLSGYGGASETTGWNTATSAPLTVTDNGAAGVTVAGIWNSAAETQDTQLDADPVAAGVQPTALNDRVPTLLDVQVCLVYGSTTQCTWSQSHTTVLRLPHAFGRGFPTAEAGPGQVALWTGEFHTEATDISVPGYTGDLTLSRSHSTFAGATDVVNGVFGPGWTAQLDGIDAGVAGMQLVDNTRGDGTIALIDGDGGTLVYESPSGTRRTTATLQAGTWVPADEDTEIDAGRLTVTGTGAATTIAYTEDDGTVTTFGTTSANAPTTAAAGRFRPTGITEPATPGKTAYIYDTAGRVVRMLAPSAPGVTCLDAQGNYTGAVGCRSLRLEYGTSGSAAGRLVNAWLDIYNPERVGGAGMDSVRVATYGYDSSGRLATVTDPRSNLSTAYGYDTGNRLVTVTPAGRTPFQMSYTASPDVKLSAVNRARPAGDPTGGTATLAAFVYDVPTSGAGLPDLSATAVSKWNQASAPTKGFAVFGPDHPVTTTSPTGITAADWEYADLQYTDANGYTVDTAKFGAGAWQLTATDYDTQGNVVRVLDERALRQVVDDALPSGATVDQLATLTVYNAEVKVGETVLTPAGTLVTDAFGPTRSALLRDGTRAWVRPHTHTDYDQGAPNSGVNPASAQPYRMETTESTYAHDPGTGQDIEAVSRTLTGYAPVVAGDPDGWALGLASTVTTDADLSGTPTQGDIVKTTRHDADGRVIEARQPTSTGSDAGTTRTAYYSATVDSVHPECGGAPQWAGLTCKVFPAAAPTSGPSLPTTVTTGYSYLLTPTTVVETSGAVTRTTNTTYLIDGRTSATAMAVTGLAGSTPNTRKETEYDPVSGAATKTLARAADGSVASAVTTAYDSWGRQTTQQTGTDPVTTTSYNAAGSVATVTDAIGTTRYTYDGTDAEGRAERRGLATKVEVVSAARTWVSVGAYDADGGLVTEKLPGGVTRRTELDTAGEPIGLRYTGQVITRAEDGTETVDPDGGWLTWSQDNDVMGRVVREWTPEGSAFTGPPAGEGPDVGDAVPYDRAYAYDAVSRLVQVRDRTADTTGVDVTDPAQVPACVTRTYAFDGNDNRLSRTTTAAAVDCAPTGGTAVTRAYDSADRPVTGAGGPRCRRRGSRRSRRSGRSPPPPRSWCGSAGCRS
ncbi:MAG TPA: DNRLRE domain-containing protein, partial [Actinokineospora sp.]|nr:DNRLRE domain-containing protein [Actinokineospora sp.]